MFQKLKLPENASGNVWLCSTPAQTAHSHRHDELELNLVVSGRGGYLCGNQCYEIGPRSLLLLFPAQEHHLLYTSPNFSMWILVFRRAFLQEIFSDDDVLLQRDPPGRFCRLLEKADSEFLTSFAARIKDDPNQHTRNTSLTCFLQEAQRSFDRASKAKEYIDLHPSVENLLRILREQQGEGDLDEMAAQAGLSRTHLSRIFHKQIGITIARFRNQLRLERFWDIYGNGQRTNLLEAALMAGFGSYAQFFRICRELTGFTPKQIKTGVPSI